jgi:hypothetical protein
MQVAAGSGDRIGRTAPGRGVRGASQGQQDGAAAPQRGRHPVRLAQHVLGGVLAQPAAQVIRVGDSR